jgi:DNA-binding response OmpR family regulator
VGASALSRKVLLIEDNLDIARSTALLLMEDGYEVEYVLNGSAAAIALPKFKPDAVVLDIGLPDFDGLRLLRRIRDSSELAGVFVVCVSGQAIARKEVLAAGADEFLRKPVEYPHLEAVLRRGLG